MTEKNRIEQYLEGYTYRKLEDNLWLLDDENHGLPQVAIMYAAPVVICRTWVMAAPKEQRLELFTKLLELNARDVVHGAYALEEDQIILIDTLVYDTMDYEELMATLDAFGLAVTQHYPVLASYR
ncbi:MAG: YbjN domain-containing protein [Spirochaetaceae bacterium]|jgi:hypothetical protein|nr:YbjN domain-containing protein [Spirochaetaceae bacterium]